MCTADVFILHFIPGVILSTIQKDIREPADFIGTLKKQEEEEEEFC